MAFLKTTRVAAICISVAAILGSGIAAEPPQSKSEYALKAVFLYNFCRFIEWPKSAFTSPTDPIIIAVIGEDPFGLLLEETVHGETLRGRAIQIQRYRNSDS